MGKIPSKREIIEGLRAFIRNNPKLKYYEIAKMVGIPNSTITQLLNSDKDY